MFKQVKNHHIYRVSLLSCSTWFLVFSTPQNAFLRESRGCFGIVRSSAFQNIPYLTSEMHFKGLITPKTKWNKIRETPCRFSSILRK